MLKLTCSNLCSYPILQPVIFCLNCVYFSCLFLLLFAYFVYMYCSLFDAVALVYYSLHQDT